jgi:hypothetical protein
MMMIAGAGMSLIGTLNSSNADEAAARYNRESNLWAAFETERQTASQEAMFRKQTKKFMGDQRTAYGASGVTQEGSPIDVMAETAGQAEYDALQLRNEGLFRAGQYRREAGMAGGKADAIKRARPLQLASSALGGGANSYMAAKRT